MIQVDALWYASGLCSLLKHLTNIIINYQKIKYEKFIPIIQCYVNFSHLPNHYSNGTILHCKPKNVSQSVCYFSISLHCLAKLESHVLQGFQYNTPVKSKPKCLCHIVCKTWLILMKSGI